MKYTIKLSVLALLLAKTDAIQLNAQLNWQYPASERPAEIQHIQLGWADGVDESDQDVMIDQYQKEEEASQLLLEQQMQEQQRQLEKKLAAAKEKERLENERRAAAARKAEEAKEPKKKEEKKKDGGKKEEKKEEKKEAPKPSDLEVHTTMVVPGVYETSTAGPFDCEKHLVDPNAAYRPEIVVPTGVIAHVQISSKGDDKVAGIKEGKVDLTAGTPQLPECTGMNGDRKGPDTDCRQIGRFNGPWPVTDDVQIKTQQIAQVQSFDAPKPLIPPVDAPPATTLPAAAPPVAALPAAAPPATGPPAITTPTNATIAEPPIKVKASPEAPATPVRV